MTEPDTNAAHAADYYNTQDVADFYRLLWGGADIHIGLFRTGEESVAEASLAMTRHLLSVAGIKAGDRVLDISCGYGGTLGELARMGCHARGLDISQLCVDEARKAMDRDGLADRVTVDVGDFHQIDSADGAWDACVCQESIIHSNDRPRVFSEVFRVLRPEGTFAFSDILTAEGADMAKVSSAFERLGAQVGATPRTYYEMAQKAGFEILHSEERPHDIAAHYDRLAELLETPVEGLDPEAATRIAASIARWQEALAGGHITWACFVARKPG